MTTKLNQAQSEAKATSQNPMESVHDTFMTILGDPKASERVLDELAKDTILKSCSS